jgi:cytochrome P450
VKSIQENPLEWQSLSPNTRRYITNRFPYGIAYEVQAEEIVVFAVYHLHRDESVWRDRL